MLKRLTKEELEEKYRKERDPTIKGKIACNTAFV